MKHGAVMVPLSGAAFTCVALVAAACIAYRTPLVHAEESPARPAYYTEKVQPILDANCYRCHAGLNHRGGLNMSSKEGMIRGGHHGPALVPGHPEQSWMVKLIRHEGPADDPMNMPPAPRPKLADADIAVIENWIRAGAAMPPAASADSAVVVSAPGH